jgi:hypothetical protein
LAFTEIRTPEKKDTDLILVVHQSEEAPNPKGKYFEIVRFFAKTLDSMGKGDREDERRRERTLHSFRRFVKTTISDR